MAISKVAPPGITEMSGGDSFLSLWADVEHGEANGPIGEDEELIAEAMTESPDFTSLRYWLQRPSLGACNTTEHTS